MAQRPTKILYSIIGNSGGHIAPAKAIISAIDELRPDEFTHSMIDLSLKVQTFWTKIAYAYAPMNKYFPASWEALYKFSNGPRRIKMTYDIFYPLLFARKAPQVIQEENPDIIISMVGPPTSGIIRALEALGKKTPVITYVTDPVTVHATWADPKADMTIVGTEEAKDTCIRFGLSGKKVKVLGFPVHPKFLKVNKSKTTLRKCYGLDPYKFTILLMGGGGGMGKMLDVTDALRKSKLDIQLVMVAGFNKELEKKLKKKRFKFPSKVLGFTDKMHELMTISDVIVTKAGAGGVWESIAMDLPIIITDIVPGQEEGNADYVKENRLGVIAKTPERILKAISYMRKHGTQEFVSNIRRIKQPMAVYDIAREIIAHADRLNSKKQIR